MFQKRRYSLTIDIPTISETFLFVDKAVIVSLKITSSIQMTNDRPIQRLNYQLQASIHLIDQWQASMTSFL